MGNGPNYLERSSSSQTGPNYLDRKMGVNWEQHEKDVEKRSGGRRRRASGAAYGKPADTKDAEFLRECKATAGAGITVNGKWLSKITQESISLGKTPLVELRLDGQSDPTPKDWVLIPALDFEILRERANGS